jgi:hypothetical protein
MFNLQKNNSTQKNLQKNSQRTLSNRRRNLIRAKTVGNAPSSSSMELFDCKSSFIKGEENKLCFPQLMLTSDIQNGFTQNDIDKLLIKYPFETPQYIIEKRKKIIENNHPLILKSESVVFHTTSYDIDKCSFLHPELKKLFQNQYLNLLNLKNENLIDDSSLNENLIDYSSLNENKKKLIENRKKFIDVSKLDGQMDGINDGFIVPKDSLGYGQFSLIEEHFKPFSDKMQWRKSINIKYTILKDICLLYMQHRNNNLDIFMEISNHIIENYVKAFNNWKQVQYDIKQIEDYFLKNADVNDGKISIFDHIMSEFRYFSSYLTVNMSNVEYKDVYNLILYIVKLQNLNFTELIKKIQKGDIIPGFFYNKSFILSEIKNEMDRVSKEYTIYKQLEKKKLTSHLNTKENTDMKSLSVLRGIQIMLVCKILGIRGWAACDICEIAVDTSNEKDTDHPISKGIFNKGLIVNKSQILENNAIEKVNGKFFNYRGNNKNK